MKPFNLAEARIVERNYCQTHVTRRLRVIALMILLTVMVYGASFVCKTMFAGEVQETKSKLADAQERCVEAKREMQVLNTTLAERKWQGQLAGESGRWLSVIDSVVGRVPPDVWLDSVKNSAAESTLDIAGQASSFEAMIAFIDALRCSEGFGEVRLESAKIASAVSVTYVDFTLGVSIKEGGQANAESGAGAMAAPSDASSGVGVPPSSPPDRGQPEPPTRGGVPEVREST